MSHPQATKTLTPGRILIVDTSKYPNNLGLLLSVRGTPTSEYR